MVGRILLASSDGSGPRTYNHSSHVEEENDPQESTERPRRRRRRPCFGSPVPRPPAARAHAYNESFGTTENEFDRVGARVASFLWARTARNPLAGPVPKT